MTRRSAALCARLGVELPIIQAPVANISTPELAAAVSNAGGLGMIGRGRTEPAADIVRRLMREAEQALTS